MTIKGLEFDLGFRAAGAVTTARLSVRVDGEPVWPVAGADGASVEIQIDDLLSHLAEFWLPLTLRQTWPLPVALERPLYLRAAAEQRWEKQSASVAEREDEALCAFEEAHDLSKCFAGMYDLPPLWLLRRGDRMIVDTRAGFRSVSIVGAMAEMTRLGDEIAARLSASKWARLIENWQGRGQNDRFALLAWTTSLPRTLAAEFANDGLLSAPASFEDAANDNDELRIAARMASALQPVEIRNILEIVRAIPKRDAPQLAQLASDTRAYIAERFAHLRAHEQGEAAANFVRDRLNLPALARCDIVAVLEGLGVSVEARAVHPAGLKALAVSGDRHGPAVFINLTRRLPDRDYRTEWSVRVDLAHELCHLLLDGAHGLSAVDVLNSRMPVEIEQRAKSFAGAFLLPTAAAEAEWRDRGSPRDSGQEVNAVLLALQKAYGVTKSVASWKLEHAAQNQDVDLSILLDSLAPNR